MKNYIEQGSSISATVHYDENAQRWNLRVFGVPKGDVNDNDVSRISSYKFAYDESGKQTGGWAIDPITNNIKGF